MNFVTSISLVVLGAMFLALLGWGSIRAAWRNCEGRRGVFAALAILAAICSIVAQKPSPDTPTITVDALLRDVGCYATNNVFHAAVTNAPSYAGVDFSDCDLMVYARERASTDAASWFELTPRKKFSQQPADYAIENATNFNYMVYLNYVPPSPVHTNGVFELYGFVVPDDDPGNLEQLSAGFINSRAVLSSPTASDYIQNGLVAMWDGIENNGLSSYDPNLAVWKDLTGNGYDIELTANAIVVSNGIKLKDVATVAGGIGMVDYSGNQNNLMFDVCVTYGAGTSASQAVIANGAISANSTRATICAKAGSKFEWSYQWNNAINVFTLNRTMTLTAGYGKGYVNTERFTGNAVDTWGFTNGKIAIGGDPRGTGYAFVKSTIHSVRVYSRELTPEEIQYNYKIDKERFNLP